MSQYKDSFKPMPQRAYYVWCGTFYVKILARTEWEACILAFKRLSQDKILGHNVYVNERGFESDPTACWSIDRVLKGAGYTK